MEELDAQQYLQICAIINVFLSHDSNLYLSLLAQNVAKVPTNFDVTTIMQLGAQVSQSMGHTQA